MKYSSKFTIWAATRSPISIWAANAVISAASYTLALALQYNFALSQHQNTHEYWIPVVVLCLSRSFAYRLSGLNSILWRHSSIKEAPHLLMAHIFSSVVFAACLSLLHLAALPASLICLELALSLLLALGVRLSARLLYEYRSRAGKNLSSPADAIVLGAGALGHFVVKTLHSPHLNHGQVSAVLDDNPECQNITVHGVKVAGPLSELESHLRENPHISSVHAAIANLSKPRLESIQKICDEFKVPLERVAAGRDSGHLLKKSSVPMDELLGRNTSYNHQSELGSTLKEKRVFVTGAGGSIGSELVRQLLQHGLSELVLLDKSEYNLYTIKQELSKFTADLSCRVTYQLGDIVNSERLDSLFNVHRPHFVFHAAAYKHVPLLEQNCYEAFMNNVVGTLNVLRAAKRCEAQRFIFISTDKAVEPSSIMGRTKRICELMVQQINEDRAVEEFPDCGPHELNTAAVRFGNVINSAGSVIPLFEKQIQSGEPITITHEKVERYFMSIPEAANLVLIAGLLGHNGEIYMLDMGKPLKIIDVAKKIRASYGRRDLPIEVVGLRPGEKLREKLYYSMHEKRKRTPFEKVFSVHSGQTEYAEGEVFSWVKSLRHRVNTLSESEIAGALEAFIRGERVTPQTDQIRINELNQPEETQRMFAA